MFGYIRKMEGNTLTLEVPSSYDNRLLKCYRNGLGTSLQISDRVSFETQRRDNNLPKLIYICLADFDKCQGCNKPFDLAESQVACGCYDGFGRNIVKGVVKITAKEERSYPYGPGFKLSMALRNGNDTYHTVIFPNSPFYDLAKEIPVDAFCGIKGEIKQQNDEHILIRVFVFDPICLVN